MKIERTEGIILKITLFQESDLILTVFTPEKGLLKLILKGGANPKRKLQSAATPFTRAEFVYRPGRGELAFCREIVPMNQYLSLRSNYNILQACCDMLQALCRSEYGERDAFDLYQLLILYLDKIKSAVSPYSVSSSFLLKIMRHEGILHLQEVCQVCKESLTSWHLFQGDSFCKRHSPLFSIDLNKEDAVTLTRLATSRSLNEILSIPLEDSLQKKIKLLFDNAF